MQTQLAATFQRYGLPEALFVDNGSPWGDASGARWTKLGVWLLKLGAGVLHSRPYHPQSRGKNERFHRTLKAEVCGLRSFHDLAELQRASAQALDLDVPASRYPPSSRIMPDRLPVIEYDRGEIVRRVPATEDYVSFKGQLWKVPQAFGGASPSGP